MDVFESLVKMVSSLAVVLALMVLIAAAARRWLIPALAGGGPTHAIRVAGSLALGGRRSILVLEVAGRTLVVAATPQQLALLTQFESMAVQVPLIKSAACIGQETGASDDTSVSGTWQRRLTKAMRTCRSLSKHGAANEL